MNRSTNLLYKKNSRLQFSEPFMPSFQNLPAPVRTVPPHYPLRDNYDQVLHKIDSYPSTIGAKRDISFPVNTAQPMRSFDDYQQSSSSNFLPFFPKTNTIQNPATSRFSNDMKLQTQNMQSLSTYNRKGEENLENEKTHTLAEVLQKSQLQALTNQQYMFQGSSQTSFLSSQQPKLQAPAHSPVFRYPSEPIINGVNGGVSQEGRPGPALIKSQNVEKESQNLYGDAEHGFDHSGKYESQDFSVFSGEKKMIKRSKNEKANTKADELMDTIEKHDLNPISLLNEVSGKLKKKVEYKITESSSGRTKVFECTCLLDGRVIGVKKGNSKQNGKTEAATAGIRSLLLDDQHITENAAIILSIQKASEKSVKKERSDNSNVSVASEDKLTTTSELEVISQNNQEIDIARSESTIDDESTRQAYLAFRQEKSAQNTKSALYELNTFARKYSTEPVWSFPLDTNEDGEFEIELQFGDLVIQEKGKKKQEAKKEAAAKMVIKIQECQKLGQPVCSDLGRAAAVKAKELFTPKREDRARKLFERSLKPTLLEKLQYDSTEFKPVTQDDNIEFESHVSSLLQKYQPDVVANENLQTFFKKIIDYTSMATSNPKQVMLDAERHLADYVKECYLVPIGSFALGSMRNNNLVMDSLLMFHQVNNISNYELLEIYQHSLETCYCLDQQSGTNTMKMNFKFNIKTDSQGRNYMEVVETEKTEGKARLNIYVSTQTTQPKLSNDVPVTNESIFPIVHVQKLYGSLDQSIEEMNAFRNLLSAMKIWMHNTGLDAIRTELLEIILLNVILSNKSAKIRDNIINSLTILSSDKLTQAILSKFGQPYQSLYEALSNDLRQELTTVSQKSLTCIYQNNFSGAQLF